MRSSRRSAQVNFSLGSFGRVRLARDRETGEFVAMKILKKAEILRMKQVDHVISEFGILRTI